MISRISYAMLLTVMVAGCGTQDKGATAATTNAAATASSASIKPTDGWSTATNESSMDGKKVVASKKFAKLSADGVTKSTIKVALTCTAATKSLTVTMRAVDYDKQLQSEMPTQFDSELENLEPVPVGLVKSKNSKPLPMSMFFALKQDDLVIWDISNLTTVRTFMSGLMDAAGDDSEALKAKNQILLMTAQTALGISGAGQYADVNSMFGAERPWIIEVSTGKDPVEIPIPADSDSVNEVIRACGAYPAGRVQTAENKPAESTVATAGDPPVPTAALAKQEPTAVASSSSAVSHQDAEQNSTQTAEGVDESNDNSQIAPSTKASFDCTKAFTAVEKLICATPSLAAADAEMAAEYKRMYAAAGPEAVAVKQGQRDFIAKRNQCANADCIADAYRARRTALAQLGS